MKKKQFLISEAEVPNDRFLIMEVKNTSIGIISLNGKIFCFLNKCPHAGAPVCEGKIDKLLVGDLREERIVTDISVLKCPWHGWEFQLEDGKSYIEGLGKLVSLKPVTEEGNVYIFL